MSLDASIPALGELSGGGPAAPLQAFFSPETVAVIGATEKPGSVGRTVLENLEGFPGEVFAVNPKHPTVLGRRAFPCLAALPGRVDLAVVVTPASTVPGLIRECVAAGVRHAIIISAGFREVGPAGVALEEATLAEARRGRLRLIGPNCLGVMAPHGKFNATFAADLARPGSVAFISQSGALCTAVLDWSLREKIGFSAFVSVGSMLDVGWGDLLTHFGDDPQTRSIVCYMESVADARGFLSAAREVALSKPIIILKVGHTAAAAKAAASHTGALTGSDAVLDAAFQRVGVLRVNTIGEMFSLAELLAQQPRPRGPRLAIVTNAGGPGALATDMLVANGGQLAPLTAPTLAALNETLPAHWSHGNPIDVLGDADAARYAGPMGRVVTDETTDGLLVILTPQSMTEATATAEALKRLVNPRGVPVLASWMGGAAVEAGRAILNDAGIPTFDYPDTAARAFALMWRYSEGLRALYETPVAAPFSTVTAADRATVEALLQARDRTGRTVLTEVESKQILQAYGIPTVETHLARTEDEAVLRAEALGFPVVLKLHSETLTHKTDVGGVKLNLRDASSVRLAWQQIHQSVEERAGPGHFRGVSVQPMIPSGGLELILGSSIDPQFGPVLLFGAGGLWVEIFKDTVLGLPPLNTTLARRLMERARIFSAFGGFRGQPPVNVAALAEVLVRFSQLVVEQPVIAEMDINPLVVSGDRILALDARVILHPADVSVSRLPRPAIRPYPTRYLQSLTLKNGERVTLRPIRPEDEPMMVAFHQTLSEATVYSRYFAPLKLDQRVRHERLSRICFIDYDRQMALVIERGVPGTERREILGLGGWIRLHGGNEAEFALLVSDAWQGQGLGTQLLRNLVQMARDERLERLTGVLLASNHAMLHVAKRAGFTLSHALDTQEFRAELVL